METIIYIATIIIMIFGIAGNILPILPGIPLIFLAATGYGWYEGFQQITVNYLIILALLTLFSVVVDYLATAYGTKYFGASRFGSWGSIVGGILGILIIPPLGILLGSWLGAVAGELVSGRAMSQAVRAGTGALIGIMSGMVVKIIIGVGMLISFIVITKPFV